MAKKQDSELIESLEAIPLFAGCNGRQLRVVAASGKRLSRQAGSIIVKKGASGVAFFVILSGMADVLRDGESVARLMPGDFFGEMALLSDKPRNAEVQAASNVELFTFTRWTFKSMVVTNPKISYVLMKTIAARQSQ